MTKIAIVDDENDILNVLQKFLSRFDELTIDTYNNPADALSKVQNGSYDIVLLDIIMPKAQGYDDGLDAISYIKKIKKTTPILVLTSDSTQKTVLSAIKKGADEYMLKPIYITNLKKILDKYDLIKEKNIESKKNDKNKEEQKQKTDIENNIKNLDNEQKTIKSS